MDKAKAVIAVAFIVACAISSLPAVLPDTWKAELVDWIYGKELNQ